MKRYRCLKAWHLHRLLKLREGHATPLREVLDEGNEVSGIELAVGILGGPDARQDQDCEEQKKGWDVRRGG